MCSWVSPSAFLCAPLRYTPPRPDFSPPRTRRGAEDFYSIPLRPSAVSPPPRFFTAEDAKGRRGCVLGSPPLRSSAPLCGIPLPDPIFHRRGRGGAQRISTLSLCAPLRYTLPTRLLTAEDAEGRRGCVLGSPPLRSSAPLCGIPHPTPATSHARAHTRPCAHPPRHPDAQAPAHRPPTDRATLAPR